LNRIAFQLFKERGDKATFAEYLQELAVLQDGEFDQRVKCWVNLLVEGKKYESKENTGVAVIDVQMIPRQAFICQLQASFP
jgi:hypothetical protein